MPLEQLGKVLYIHDAAVQGNGLDLQIGGIEQVDGIFDAPRPYVFRERFTCFFFEYGAKISQANPLTGGQAAWRKIGRQIGVDHENGLLNDGREAA